MGAEIVIALIGGVYYFQCVIYDNHFLYSTGYRVSEVCSVNIKDINFDEKN